MVHTSPKIGPAGRLNSLALLGLPPFSSFLRDDRALRFLVRDPRQAGQKQTSGKP